MPAQTLVTPVQNAKTAEASTVVSKTKALYIHFPIYKDILGTNDTNQRIFCRVSSVN